MSQRSRATSWMWGAIVKQGGSSKNHILTHSKHVGRIRALIKKAPARKDAVEINDAILNSRDCDFRFVPSPEVS